jgi:hypothetical protein
MEWNGMERNGMEWEAEIPFFLPFSFSFHPSFTFSLSFGFGLGLSLNLSWGWVGSCRVGAGWERGKTCSTGLDLDVNVD